MKRPDNTSVFYFVHSDDSLRGNQRAEMTYMGSEEEEGKRRHSTAGFYFWFVYACTH